MVGLPIKLLLIEDNPGDARLIREMLRESSEYEITVKENLTEGLMALRKGRYDVLILDLGLPECYGLDTLKRVRGGIHDMAIVVLTGFDDMDCALDSIKQGAQDYVVKGQIDSPTLIRVIRYAIERKETEMALRKTEKQASAALEAARAFSFSYDLITDSFSLGGGIEEITGFRLEDVDGLTLDHWERFIHDEDRTTFRAAISACMGGGERIEVRFRFHAKKGTMNLMILGLTEEENGQPARLVGLMRDITSEVRRDAQFEQLNAALEEKNREMQQLFHITSHDLRSPLANTRGFTEDIEYFLKDLRTVLHTPGIPEDTRERIAQIVDQDITVSLGYIKNALAKMDNLITGLLKISRLGTAEIALETLDMDVMLRGIGETQSHEMKQKRIRFEVRSAPPCVGDERQINQVFSNLIGNAIKYFDPQKEGYIIVEGTTEKGKVVYSVRDNGIGIRKEHQEKVFGLFQRVDRKSTPGDGLGLTAVQRILSRHNGKVWLESEFGKGSTFFVSLPAPEP